MSEETELERIRHLLRLAHREVDQRDPRPDLAIQYLKQIKDDIEEYPQTPESAEYTLLLGEIFTAKHNSAAESFLREAGEKIAQLADCVPELELRLHDRLGYFFEKVLRSPSRARGELEMAKAAAVKLGVRERTAHIQMRIIRLDLEIDHSPELGNFMTLRRVGRQNDYTDEEQFMAWHQHCGDRSADQVPIVYARGLQQRSEQYFLDLLSSVRVLQ